MLFRENSLKIDKKLRQLILAFPKELSDEEMCSCFNVDNREDCFPEGIQHLKQFIYSGGEPIIGITDFWQGEEKYVEKEILFVIVQLDVDLAEKLQEHIVFWISENILPEMVKRHKKGKK